MGILQENDTYLGFLDQLSAMRAGRAKKTLEKTVKHNGKVMERRDFIFTLVVDDGLCPEMAENSMGEGKDEYRLYNEKEHSYYEINKTGYDFACWLVKNKIDRKSAFEIIDKNNKHEEEMERKEAEEVKKRVKAAEKRKAETEAFNQWISKEVAEYSDTEKMEIQKAIFLDVVGKYDPDIAVRTLVLIDNIDKPMCREELREIMRYDNKATCRTFAHITGLRVPKTNKEIQEMLDSVTSADYVGVKPYKSRMKPGEKELEYFFIAEMGADGETKFTLTRGEYLEKYGLKLFIHKLSNGNVAISSAEVGYKLVSGANKTDALETLKNRLKKMDIEKLKDQIYEVGESKGWSPWCDMHMNKALDKTNK